MAILGIDHIIVIGHELNTMIRQFQSLGFTVTPGGRHQTGTHNALIALSDGSYIELLSFWEPDPSSRRWQMLQSGGGLCEFMLTSDDIDRDIADIRERGIAYGNPVRGSRTRPDGIQVEWMDGPAPENSHLPYLIQDVTHRGLRVPAFDARLHPNSVTGTKQLTVAGTKTSEIVRQYTQLLGRSPTSAEQYKEKSATAEWEIGSHRLTICQTNSENRSSGRTLARRDGPICCTFYGDRKTTLDPSLTSGAHFRIDIR